VPTDFDTDIFQPIIAAIGLLTNEKYDSDAYFNNDVKQLNINRHFKIIADHVKASTFAIADGAIPGNKDRGYVLRRLIRRAMISARALKIKDNFITDVVNNVIISMDDYYPYLRQKQTQIVEILSKEEQLFKVTLENGLRLFDELVLKNGLHIDNVFKLVDTYGFPFEIIVELANERSVKIDEAAYEKKLQSHQKISRANLHVKGMLSQNKALIEFTTPSTFDYTKLSIKANIIALFDENFKPVEVLNKIG
jgi:alanyl-tRNA synthetase